MRIKNNIMKAIFNNKIKINILLYFIALILKFIIKINIIMHIKETGNYKSLFIKYVLYIPVRIRDIII